MSVQLPKHIVEALEKRRNLFIIELSNDGFKHDEIGSLFNLSKGRISQIVNDKQLTGPSDQKGQ